MRKSIKDIEGKTVKELEKEVVLLHQEITKTTLEMSAQPVKDTNIIKKKRHQMARMLTVLNRKHQEKESK
jgi:ribosomal protein L29